MAFRIAQISDQVPGRHFRFTTYIEPSKHEDSVASAQLDEVTARGMKAAASSKSLPRKLRATETRSAALSVIATFETLGSFSS